MIGIILSSGLIRKTISGYNDPIVQFYKELAKTNKVDICFYNVRNISLATGMVKAIVYNHRSRELRHKKVTVPKVNLYRGYSYITKKETIKKIKYFSRNKGNMFFNVMTNKDRSKYNIYEYLESFDDIAPLLPKTANLSFSKMIEMLNRYEKIYIKPKRSCKGNNIHVLQKTTNGYKAAHILRGKETVKDIPKEKLRNYYSSTFSSSERFIVQQGIDSKKYKGNKFDFRVFPQKNKAGIWQITGMYARVADKCSNVTNRDQGGYLKFNLKSLIDQRTRKKIKQTCIKIAKVLESKNPQIIDLGLDIAVDRQENVWLIEANFRPYRSRINSRHYRVLFEHAVWYYNKMF